MIVRLYLFIVFCREIVTSDWKKWKDLLDDLNDDALLSVTLFVVIFCSNTYNTYTIHKI